MPRKNWHQVDHERIGVGYNSTKLSAAIRAYQAGYRTRPPIIFGIGDSNFTGEGSGTSGTAMLGNAFATSPMQQAADLIGNIKGIPVKKTAVFGEGNSGNNGIAVTAYDPRLILGAGWDRTGIANTIGGRFIYTNSTTDYLTLNLGEVVTAVEIYYPIVTGGSTSVGVYNSSNILIGTMNQSASGADSMGVLRISATLPDGIVKIKNINSGSAFVGGVIAYPTSCIVVAQGTWSAAKAIDYSTLTNVWSGCGFLDLIQPDLTVIALTINDINAGTSASAYNTSLSAIVAKASLTGDVILMTGAPGSGTNYTSNNTWLTLEQEMQKVAQVYGCETISMHKEFVSSAAIVAAGMSYNTLPHLNAAGYAKTAQSIAGKIKNMA